MRGDRGQSTASSRSTSSSRTTSRRSRSRSTSPRRERYGLKPGDVRRASGILLASEEVGDIFRDGKAYDVHVWSTPETRSSLTSIRELPIDTPDGGQVRLDDVADVQHRSRRPNVDRAPGPRRDDRRRGQRERARSRLGGERRRRRARRQSSFPLGYHAEVLGEYEERQARRSALLLFGDRARRSGSSCCCRRRSGAGAWRRCPS